jgi:hypothetical protein
MQKDPDISALVNLTNGHFRETPNIPLKHEFDHTL